MGCVSSKRIEATVDVYRPTPSSFAVFDINSIEEPWLKNDNEDESDESEEKPSHVPNPLLEKLKAIEDSTRTWDEVSKDLEDLKPKLKNIPALSAPDPTPKSANSSPQTKDNPFTNRKIKRKSFSFHTLEELEARAANPTQSERVNSVKSDLKKSQSSRPGSRIEKTPEPVSRNGFPPQMPKSLKENIFILRDRQERENQGKSTGFVKRNPLDDFEENCPSGGADSVVVYTTSLGGVRRTYEDCNKVRQLMETHLVAYDERDVSLHGGFLNEMRDLLGECVSVPRVFVKGRYVGGVDEVVGLNETGRLSRILNWAKVERGVGRLGCEGCGGARFVPCLECGGSCKVVVGEKRERCGECNENGLVHCPLCM